MPNSVGDAKKPTLAGGQIKSGGDLLSQGVAPQVPLALTGLASVFGTGKGVLFKVFIDRRTVADPIYDDRIFFEPE
jgi:hypothetical protein